MVFKSGRLMDECQRNVRITGLEIGAEHVRWDGNWQEEDEKCQNSVGREEGEKIPDKR